MKKLFLLLIAALALQACSSIDNMDASGGYGIDETRAIPPRTFYAQLDEFVGRYPTQALPSDLASERMHKIIFAAAMGHYLAEPDPQNRDLYSGIYQSWRIAANTGAVAASFAAGDDFEHLIEELRHARTNRSIEPFAATRAANGWGEQANTLAGVLPLLFAEVEGELAAQMLSVNDRIKLMYVCDFLPAYLDADPMDFTDYMLSARLNDPFVDEAIAGSSGSFFTFEYGYEWLWTHYPGDMYFFDLLVSALPVIAAQQSPDFISEFGEFCQNPDYYDFVPEEQFPKLLVSLALANEAAKYWNANRESHTLSISPELSPMVPEQGGTYTLQVTSSSPWTCAISHPDRVSLSPASGAAGTTQVTVNIGRYTTSDSNRIVYTLTFNSLAGPVVYRITQSGGLIPPYPGPISVTPGLIDNVPVAGGIYKVYLTSDTAWDATSMLIGVEINPSSGPEGRAMEVEVKIPRNTSTSTLEKRSFPVFFTSGEESAILTVNQYNNVTLPGIRVDPTSISAPSGGGTYTVHVNSASSWTLGDNQMYSFIKVVPSSGNAGTTQVTITLPSNWIYLVPVTLEGENHKITFCTTTESATVELIRRIDLQQ